MATYLGSLAQLCCGEGGTLQTNIAGVCGVRSAMGHTGFVPAHGGLCFPGLHCSGSAGELPKAGCASRAHPRSKLLRFRCSGIPQRHRLGWECALCPSQVPAAQVTRCLARTLSQVGCASSSPPQVQLLGFLGAPGERRLRCAVCLLWGADLWLQPSWQMSTVQDPRKTWLATGSLLTVWWRMLALGLRVPLVF